MGMDFVKLLQGKLTNAPAISAKAQDVILKIIWHRILRIKWRGLVPDGARHLAWPLASAMSRGTTCADECPSVFPPGNHVVRVAMMSHGSRTFQV